MLWRGRPLASGIHIIVLLNLMILTVLCVSSCGDPAGDCSSQPCSGFNGICTGSYIGCPCVGADFNAGPSTESSAGLLNPSTASGFQSNQSSSWIATGTRQLSSEQYLGISGNGQFGTDAVGLGVDASTGLTLPVSVVAGVTTEPFYMGTLGLKPENSSASSGSPASLISQLKLQNLIPSLAYGYTAGAIYSTTILLSTSKSMR